MANRLSQRQRAFEVLLADLSSRFANIPGDEVQNKIEIALRQLLAFLGFDRSSFAEFDTDGRLNVLCSVAVKGVEPFPLGPAPSFLNWYVRETRTGKIILMRSVEDLPPEGQPQRNTFVSPVCAPTSESQSASAATSLRVSAFPPLQRGRLGSTASSLGSSF